MSDEETIAAYVRENRGRYTDVALRAQLVAAGHDPRKVDDALRLVAEEIDGETDVRRPAAIIALAAFLGAAVLIGFVFGGSSGDYIPDIAGSTAIALLYLLPGFLISLLAIAIVGGRAVPRQRILTSLAIALTIPAVILVALTGFCIAQVR